MNEQAFMNSFENFELLAKTAYTSDNNNERQEAEARLMVFLKDEDADQFCLRCLAQNSSHMTTMFCAAWGLKRAVLRKWLRIQDMQSNPNRDLLHQEFCKTTLAILHELWRVISTFHLHHDPMDGGRFGFNQIVSAFAMILKRGLIVNESLFTPLMEDIVLSLPSLIQSDLPLLMVVLIQLTELTKEIADSQLNKMGIRWRDYITFKKRYEAKELFSITKFVIQQLPGCISTVQNEEQLKIVYLMIRFLEVFSDWDFGVTRGTALSQEDWFQPSDTFGPLMIAQSPGDVTFFTVVSECYKTIRQAAAQKGIVHEIIVTLRAILNRLGRFKARKMLAGRNMSPAAASRRMSELAVNPPTQRLNVGQNFNVTETITLPLFAVLTELIQTEHAIAAQPGVDPADVEEELMVLTQAAYSLVDNAEVDMVAFLEASMDALKTVYQPLTAYLMTALSTADLDIPSLSMINSLESIIRFWAVVQNRLMLVGERNTSDINDRYTALVSNLQTVVDSTMTLFIRSCLISVDQAENDDTMEGGDSERKWSDKFQPLIAVLRPLGQFARLSPMNTVQELGAKYKQVEVMVNGGVVSSEQMDELCVLILFTTSFLVEYPVSELANYTFNGAVRIPNEFLTYFKEVQPRIEELFMGLLTLFDSVLDKCRAIITACNVDQAIRSTGLSAQVLECYLIGFGEISMAYLCQHLKYKQQFPELTQEPNSQIALTKLVQCLVKSLILNPTEPTIGLAAAEVLNYLGNPARPTSLYLWMAPSFQDLTRAIGSFAVSSSGDNFLAPLESEVHAETLSLISSCCGSTCCSFESSRLAATEMNFTGQLERSGTLAAADMIAHRQQELLNFISPFVGELFAKADRIGTESSGIDSRESTRIGLWMNNLAGVVDGAMLACSHSSFLDNDAKRRVDTALNEIRSNFIEWISQKGSSGKTVPSVLAQHAFRLVESPQSYGFCHSLRLLIALCKNVLPRADPAFQEDCTKACMVVLDAITTSFKNIVVTNRSEEILESIRWFFKLVIVLLKSVTSDETDAYNQWVLKYALASLNNITPTLMRIGGGVITSLDGGRFLHAYLSMCQLTFEDPIGRRLCMSGELDETVLGIILDFAHDATLVCRTTQGRVRFAGICVTSAIIVACREIVCDEGLISDSVSPPIDRPVFALGAWPFSAAEIGVAKLCVSLFKLVLRTESFDQGELDQITGIVCSAMIFFGLRTYCFRRFCEVLVQELQINPNNEQFKAIMASIEKKVAELVAISSPLTRHGSPCSSVSACSRRDVETMSYERDEFRDLFNVFVLENRGEKVV